MMEKQKNTKDLGHNLPFTVPINAQLFGYYQWCETQRRLMKPPIKNVTRRITKRNSAIKKEIPSAVVAPTAITDIDTGYFTDVAGRPIRETFSRYQYVDQIRKVLQAQLLIGYYRDDYLRIDHQFTEESRRLAAVERQYRHYNSAFEKYLSNDHEASMEILAEAYEEVRKSNDLVTKRDKVSNQFGQARLEVYQWEEMWRIAKMCHEFFRRIISRLPQLITHQPVVSPISRKSTKQTSIVGTMEGLVEAFEIDIGDDDVGCEEIGLKDPHELSRIFAAIEQRNLDALIHLESLAGPIAEMTTSIVRAEELIGDEISLIEESLEGLKSLIEMSEQRATKLESYADYLLHKVFRELVCSDYVLHLRIFIEDTYESCVGPNDASLDSYSMMRVIEKTYESLNISLDSLPQEIVKICEKDGFAWEMRRMREAEDAAKKFGLMHRLLAALERIMDSPQFDSKFKSKSKLITSNRKVNLALSTPNATASIETKAVPNSNVAFNISCPFFNENCQSIDEDISNDLTIKAQKMIAHKQSMKNSPRNDDVEDCRDEI